jgi:hypothetical protein
MDAGKSVSISDAPQPLRTVIEHLGCRVDWSSMTEEKLAADTGALRQVPVTAGVIRSMSEANGVANNLARQLASFVPTEDRANMLESSYGTLCCDAVKEALAYLMSELLDNVVSHSRTREHPNSIGWVAAQYYPAGDLVRVSVVDDGCGFLATMRDMPEDPPKDHWAAIERAFVPFASSKRLSGLYADRSHMGMGLTVCRDICTRLNGIAYAASGNAWVVNPGMDNQSRRKLLHPYQGVIVSLELHRRAITPGIVADIVSRYMRKKDLPVRFS